MPKITIFGTSMIGKFWIFRNQLVTHLPVTSIKSIPDIIRIWIKNDFYANLIMIKVVYSRFVMYFKISQK